MKAVIQRVKNASCTVDGVVTGSIESGLLVYFGVDKDDEEWILLPFLEKIVKLRIFQDENDKMNLSIKDVNQAILIISQFTLCANVYRGNRPSFDNAMEPSKANSLYQKAITMLRDMGIHTETGIFGAHMDVQYLNDGPITFIVDSKEGKFRK